MSALVYLATTPAGSIGLVVTTEVAEAVWTDFTTADLNALLVKRDGTTVIGGYLRAQVFEPALLTEALAEMVPILGAGLMSKVADKLRECGIEHVILSPTGHLGLLPLHAAQYVANGAALCFLDEFTVTYTPSARALLMATNEARKRTGLRFVGVGNPMPHPHPLLAARAELEAITMLFATDTRWPLYGTEATKAALSDRMPNGTYLHFACHGLFDPEDPLASRLELSGRDTLSLRDLLDGVVRPTNTRLAVLSACQSVISNYSHLPDEIFGLPLGFLQAGVPGVVGTLWPVDDLSTALIMTRFYEFHLKGDPYRAKAPMAPGQALCEAQRWLRSVTRGALEDYFATHPTLDNARVRSAHRAKSDISALAERCVQDIPFADQPYLWAPFIFIGA
jgi:CHAT domain-containing protein